MVLACSLVVLALGACVPLHQITIREDGTFDPPTLEINEGDAVFWVREDANGNPVFFTTTDAIARIGQPAADETKDQICGAVAGGSSEPVTGLRGADFSGPKRQGLSGIHVLGPQGHGFIETTTSDLNADCNAALNPEGDADVRYGTVVSVTNSFAGTRDLLCLKEVRIRRQWVPAADETQGHISQVVPSTWDNPDIAGVVLRVRWKDFQYHDGTSVVTVWDDIDREFREAIKRGKMISINFHAGVDTPDFIFNDFVSPVTGSTPPESNVEPVFLRDFGSEDVTPAGCGSSLKLGSPTDPNYVEKIKGLYAALAEHVRADARFFQALGYVKVSGLNLFTGEARLPRRCLDPDEGTERACVCNTQIWAGADVTQTLTYPYTPTGLYTFYNDVENQILTSFLGEKSLHYMLIQDGFPRVKDGDNYFRDREHKGDDRVAGTADDWGPDGMDGNEDDGFVGSGFPGPFGQTEKVLEYGRLGRFAQPGYPEPLPDDLATGKLFVAQHSGLSLHPRDIDSNAPFCPQTESPPDVYHREFLDANGKIYHDVWPHGVPSELGEVGSGCPNQWAAEQGYLGQLIGFQTSNEINDQHEVDSALWNMMSASNAAYFEIYEVATWVIARENGTGPGAVVLDEGGYFPRQGREYQKNLYQWGQQLHERRRKLASLEPTNVHMADPFPPVYLHSFSEPLEPNEVRDLYFIDPGTCMASDSEQPYGHIRVVGQ
jgi:hypothetical protein